MNTHALGGAPSSPAGPGWRSPGLLQGVRLAVAADVPHDRCLRCHGPAQASAHIPAAVPFWLVALGLVLTGLLMPLAILQSWGPGDLYDQMAAGIRGGWRLQIPRVTPGAVFLAAGLVWQLASRRSTLGLPACRACQRATRVAWCFQLLGMPLAASVGALLLYELPTLAVAPMVLHGMLLLPLVMAASSVSTWLWRRWGLSLGPAQAGCAEARGILVARLPLSARVTVSRTPSKAWGLPLMLSVVLASWATTQDIFRTPCGYGTLPLIYRHGATRVRGCCTPDGARHGTWLGGETPETAQWQGSFRHGQRGRPFAFFDGRGGRVEAGFCPDACGTWRYLDAAGAVYRTESYTRGPPDAVEGTRCDFRVTAPAANEPCVPYSLWP